MQYANVKTVRLLLDVVILINFVTMNFFNEGSDDPCF